MMKKIACSVMALFIAVTCMTVYRTTFSAAESAEKVSAGTQSQYAQNEIQGGAILHCFCWSYNEIRQNLAAIAQAGYSAVQTSPVQQPKDYMSGTIKGQWWKVYQPLSLSVSDSNNWLGSKAELQALCTEAENYNIKVIVDIVANHVANKGSDGGGYSYVSPYVESSLQNANYYHTYNTRASDSNRLTITQYHLGMPDLNTGNSYIQSRVLGLLKECVDLGVDGFRFDAAKHIEVPEDNSSYASNFWPYVTNGILSYNPDVYMYAEILGSAGIATANYTKYHLSVTEDGASDSALTAANNGNASSLKNFYLNKEENPNQAVMWAESHDTYMRDKNPTSNISNSSIVKAWAITGARNDITSLYFARPGTSTMMGSSNSADTTWKSKEVTEINKFKNYFKGQSEYLSSSGSTAYNERGTSGVTISKLDGSGTVSLPSHTMASGTYKDQITGNTFTVSGGYIQGTVGSSGVAVVYNAPAEQIQPTTAKPTTPPVNVLIGDVHEDNILNIKDATMIQRCVAGYESLSAKQQAAADCDGNGSVTVNDATELQRYIAYISGNSRIGTTVSMSLTDPTTPPSTTVKPTTAPTTAPPATQTVTFANNLGWSGTISCYYWSSSNTGMVSWPGTPMNWAGTDSSGNYVYRLNIPADAENVIFTNGTYQTVDITISGNARYKLLSSKDSLGHYYTLMW